MPGWHVITWQLLYNEIGWRIVFDWELWQVRSAPIVFMVTDASITLFLRLSIISYARCTVGATSITLLWKK
jgi:hypothetical protein